MADEINDPDDQTAEAPQIIHQRSGRKRISVDEVLDALNDLVVDIEVSLVNVDNTPDGPKVKRSNWNDLKFGRLLVADLTPNPDMIEDDLTVDAAIYARYNFILAKADRYMAQAKAVAEQTRAMVKTYIRMTWNNPNIPVSSLTVDMVDSLATCDQRVVVAEATYENVKEARAIINGACQALKMKHENCLEIARNRRAEWNPVKGTLSSLTQKNEHGRSGIMEGERPRE